MNLNVIGGAIAVAALAGIFWYGHSIVKAPPAVEPPAPVAVHPPVTPPVITAPAPSKPNPGVVYHRVQQGGGKGDPVECKSVTPYSDGKTPQELAEIAKQLGVTHADLAKYYVCVTD